ncbi:glycosyltransferase involved in cell wall biosynthesis [Agromyces flavus]|uniref:Glycosyltransferase involved in cell wall biosynthesis n=1 Tax=Agromyces flavus TaxID=589382 RepID=A0A1H1Z845_9MICO|nr:glycosyltransferase family 1 protein [Agromyces flavus]MCP2366964.1 glycosyltransferase involved in cell wall biosynthesis [Agromyces flavus]SDT29840.1 Glycosyltransferase involved in cell wall bisynthesis [Agromyces flavus]
MLTIATVATSAPMGASVYEERVTERAAGALGDGWAVRRSVFRSMSSPLPGNRRLPFGAVTRASPAIRRQFGRLLYPGGTVTHRMNLELPPASHGDVITLHDVVAWRFPDESTPVAAAAEEARRADAVICVSEFSANEAVEFLGVRDPYVVHNGIDEAFFDAAPLGEADRAALGLPDRYVLHAGGASSRKNLPALAEAWPLVHRNRPELTLVLSGPPHPTRTALFEGLPGTRLLGRVADALVPGLVAGAAAVVVPSLYEGFGLPVLEAMAANVPVVAARTSSLPEIAGDAAVLVEPTGAGVAEGLLAVTGDASAVAALVAAGRARASGFTWDASARAHARVWRSLS